MKILSIALSLSVILTLPAAAQPDYPQHISAPHGEVLIAGPADRHALDVHGYAAARRVGDMVYVSGVIIGPGGDDKGDGGPEAFKAQTRRALRAIEKSLRAAGGGWDDVVMINSFHVWDSPHFKGDRMDQLCLIAEVRGEFSKAPPPAWTAVGTTGLLDADGVVEIQVIAKIAAKP